MPRKASAPSKAPRKKAAAKATVSTSVIPPSASDAKAQPEPDKSLASEQAPPPEDSTSAYANRKVVLVSTITLEMMRCLGEMTARGLTANQACLSLGVTKSAFEDALKRERPALAFKRAQAAWVDRATRMIETGARGWQGYAWLLERRYTTQFNKKEVEINNNHVSELVLNDSQLSELGRLALQEFGQVAASISDAKN